MFKQKDFMNSWLKTLLKNTAVIQETQKKKHSQHNESHRAVEMIILNQYISLHQQVILYVDVAFMVLHGSMGFMANYML